MKTLTIHGYHIEKVKAALEYRKWAILKEQNNVADNLLLDYNNQAKVQEMYRIDLAEVEEILTYIAEKMTYEI